MVKSHANKSWSWRQADAIRHFMVFLVVDGPIKIYSLWHSTAQAFEGQVAVVTTARNLGKPLFQDYTREGRFIGFFFRIGRIVIGAIIQVLIALLFVVAAIIWVILPFYIAYQIFNNLAAVSGLIHA